MCHVRKTGHVKHLDLIEFHTDECLACTTARHTNECNFVSSCIEGAPEVGPNGEPMHRDCVGVRCREETLHFRHCLAVVRRRTFFDLWTLFSGEWVQNGPR